MLEASQLDTYGLQFTKPTFISLATGATIPNVPIAGVRIGLNGSDDRHGQTYVPLNATVGGSTYTANGQQMSPFGAVIGLENGPLDDMFFLSFERIGALSHTVPDPVVPPPTTPADSPAEADIGLRTFDEINATLSQLTGVPQTDNRVRATYDLVKQALPTIEKFGTFGPSQQTALAQLSMQYCNVMIDDNTMRTAFFGALDGSGTGVGVFGSAGSPNTANRDQLVNALINKAVGSGMAFQVTATQIRDELQNGVTDPDTGYVTPGLINRLVSGPTGASSTGGRTVMKAACGAVLGSGATLIQ
jgi:hypothetical protein